MVTDLRPETYTQSLLNVRSENLVTVEMNASNVQANGQGIFPHPPTVCRTELQLSIRAPEFTLQTMKTNNNETTSPNVVELLFRPFPFCCEVEHLHPHPFLSADDPSTGS
ncbi:hypothetical protein TNIN_26711 [Trichonephila inaurata madagascariensis]|uniref:Uncharacterized protein n=1 Tax=Trichonephila inaurata madagascariensis TaxID=2747483 RepID=A0A8X6YTN7_9ARAC|nr:hypothetical protein TNIN_26711 [Trichonephila inaurata madagascariensis]